MSATGCLPHISAVVVTRNRASVIPSAVASILANDYPDFDLTIVDQSTTDATRLVLEALVPASTRLHYVHLDRAGVSRANNVALRQTSGAILAFTDDDCVTPSYWLTSIVAAFRADPDADLLFGEVAPPIGGTSANGVTPAMRIPRAERLCSATRFRLGFKVLGGMGANFAVRRRLFDKIGGYDETLGPGAPLPSGQDWDIAYRALCAGSVVLRRPEVRVVHQYGTRTQADWAARLGDYGVGDGAFFFKHVRCGDAVATWLFLRWLIRHGGRTTVKRLLRRGVVDFTYPRALLVGAWRSMRFAVDRESRLYRPGEAAPLEGPA